MFLANRRLLGFLREMLLRWESYDLCRRFECLDCKRQEQMS